MIKFRSRFIYIISIILFIIISFWIYKISVNAAPWIWFWRMSVREFALSNALTKYKTRWNLNNTFVTCNTLWIGGSCTAANIKQKLLDNYGSCYIRDLEVLNWIVADRIISTWDYTILMNRMWLVCPSQITNYTNGVNSQWDYIVWKWTQTDPWRFEWEDLTSTNWKANSLRYYVANAKRFPWTNEIRPTWNWTWTTLPQWYYAVDFDGSSAMAYQAVLLWSVMVWSWTSTSPYFLNWNNPSTCSTYRNTYWISANSFVILKRYWVDLYAYCDMTTDGWTYTMVRITWWKNTCQYNVDNSCKDYWMDIIVPRNLNHLTSIYNAFWQTLLWIYWLGGWNYTWYPMNSSNWTVASNRKAVDWWTWFLRSTTHSEPNWDYNAWCRLSYYGGIDSYWTQFNDWSCWACYTSYICSPNDK